MEETERAVMRASENYFRPEFINRLDAVCFFKPLSRSVIRQIAQRELNDVIAREGVTRRNLRVSVDDSVIDVLVERGYDLRFGALSEAADRAHHLISTGAADRAGPACPWRGVAAGGAGWRCVGERAEG